jgi:hypothetical protein
MDTDKVDFDELLSRSTVRDGLSLRMTGVFPSEEDAKEFRYTMLGFGKVFGSVFDLSALDGITVADDYVAALGSIDRGYPGMKAATPTRDEFGAGFAMAVPVLRNGEHRSHIVLDSALVRPSSTHKTRITLLRSIRWATRWHMCTTICCEATPCLGTTEAR